MNEKKEINVQNNTNNTNKEIIKEKLSYYS